jgi:hypothetical protein
MQPSLVEGRSATTVVTGERDAVTGERDAVSGEHDYE